MTNDIFGGLGGLMKGLSGFMPQDDPNVKLMNAQSELDDLKKQETTLFAEIGRQAFAANPSGYAQTEKLRLIQMNIASAEERLNTATSEKAQAEQLKKSSEARNTCPACGHLNPDGTKFCQECGGRIGNSVCQTCGAALQSGTRFCGECGAHQA